VIRFSAFFRRDEKTGFYVSQQYHAATDAQAPQVRDAANDQQRRNFWMRAEPIRECIDFAQRAQRPDGDALSVNC
jgi:hypothetical protein